MQNNISNQLSALFQKWSGKTPELILPLAPSGSNRRYYRLQAAGISAIGCHGKEAKENLAFVEFSKHFKQQQLAVPEIYATDLEKGIYLQEDLGSTTLFSFLLQRGKDFSESLLKMYKKSVEELARLQIIGGQDFPYKYCYPRPAFDKQSMLWDFNTFKYYFLKLAGFTFDEEALENDFHKFADYLLSADCSHFMFRDFQSRNIMMKAGAPFFIDYQGGRQGALQYDLASLLFQARANMSSNLRETLLEHYLDTAEKLTAINRPVFIRYYYGFVLIRCIQVLGSYGYRGLHERKEHFIKSIPFAIKNLQWLLPQLQMDVDMPELKRVLTAISQTDHFDSFDPEKGAASVLTVSVKSFSYKQGIPGDPSGNGGGFVFDCRALHNPGRYEPYKKLTGRDKPVIEFLQGHSNIQNFLNNIYYIVDPAIENYIERSFTSLCINFGCTGGQHRSVYCADAMKRHIEQKYGVVVRLEHVVQEQKGWKN